MYFTHEDIDRLISEDVPYMDLTGHMLKIPDSKGRITYYTRENITVCGTEEIKKIFKHLGIGIEAFIPAGEQAEGGQSLISGTGPAQSLHLAWKVGQNILEYTSAIATKTKNMLDTARGVNPNIMILATRKGFPGTKKLAMSAVMAGGAVPHRLGLSETILVFKQHLEFIGGIDGFISRLPDLKISCCEKKIIVEAESAEDAARLCEAGVDGIQFDKFLPSELKTLVPELRKINSKITLLAAGGVNESNIREYAGSGVTAVVTTSLFSAKPADVGVKMESLA